MISRWNAVRAPLAAAFATALVSHSSPAVADSVRLKAKYVVSLSGLKVGELRMVGTVSRSSYDVTGSGKIAGLPQLLTTFKGETQSAGRLSRSGVRPAKHAIAYNTVKKDYRTRMSFANGSVRSLDLTPPYKAKRSRVPIRDAHKHNVIDPVSATILPGPKSGPLVAPESCNHTLPIFDGRERFDMRLTFKEIGQVKAREDGGYSGPVLVCTVDYKPIAGHRRKDKLVERWSRSGAIEAWFVPIEDINALVFYRGRAPSPFGPAVVYPKAFRIKGNVS